MKRKIKIEGVEVNSPTAASNIISDYESIRGENIRRNEEFLASIGIAQMKAQTRLVPPKANKIKSNKANNSLAIANAAPVRKSSRITIERVKSEIKDLGNNTGSSSGLNESLIASKSLELELLLQSKAATIFQPGDNHLLDAAGEVTGDVVIPTDETKELAEMFQIHSNINNTNNSSISGSMRIIAGRSTKASPSKSSTSRTNIATTSEAISIPPTQYSYSQYRDTVAMLRVVGPEHAQKIVASRITAIAIHPTEHRIIVAAGDALRAVSVCLPCYSCVVIRCGDT